MSEGGSYRVVVVGAGAAGVGLGVALLHAGVEDFVLVDRHEVGASFLRWPREMRFISPSFPANSIGMLDLNAVAVGTSPGFSLRREHPDGQQFAGYLKAVAEYYELPVRCGVDVLELNRRDERFVLWTSQGEWMADFVVWATGEYQYPRTMPFPGGELCRHNSLVGSWSEFAARDAVVIGGYESGIDAAIHLSAQGKRVTVLDQSASWESESSDPSVSLSPFTHERLQAARATGKVELVGGVRVAGVERSGRKYLVQAEGGRSWKVAAPPILATGFLGGHRMVADWFELRGDGYPVLTEMDESTMTPGLFLIGPAVRHDKLIFCFIYKFRQRFAVVARAIAERMGVDSSALEAYRSWGMFLDDLSCCGEECVC